MLRQDLDICDFVSDSQLNFIYNSVLQSPTITTSKELNVLSLFSGCGGMDIGFEGGFICHKKSINSNTGWINKELNDNWIEVQPTKFKTIFANDILKEAEIAWLAYMKRYNYDSSIYRSESIVDLVKMHYQGIKVFPENVDIVTGGFPCQDFSVAGKRKGFESNKDHEGNLRTEEEPSEETRGKLYYWMKKVIDITKPKIFVAENVKGLVNFGNVKDIIQKDFSNADDGGYIVLNPRVLHAGNYGVPESRERVIFIGIKKSELNKKVLEDIERDEISPELDPYPKPTHSCTFIDPSLLPKVVCNDIFSNLKEPTDSLDLSQQNYSKAKYMGAHCQGQTEISLNSIAPTIRSEHHGNIEYRRLSKEHGGKIIEELDKGLQERRLTPRECALIQTFPPDYPFVRRQGYTSKFALTASSAYKVIGNAVPPVLAYNIAQRLQQLWPLYFK